MKGKLFVVNAHTGFMVEKKAQTPRCDIWLSTSAGKGKQKRFAILLRSLTDVKRKIQFNEFYLNELKESQAAVDLAGTAEQIAEVENELATEIALKLSLDAVGLVLDGEGDIDGIVTTCEQWIDRNEAEHMIRSYLEFFHGYSNVRLKFKRPKTVIGQI